MAEEIKSERLDAIQVEADSKKWESKSQKDSWLIARLCGEIIQMDKDINELNEVIQRNAAKK